MAWSTFRQWLEYFAAKFDTKAVAVPPHYTSQKCSDCGVIVKKSLSTRTHKCSCGCELQRDTNAAINILNLGKNRLGHSQINEMRRWNLYSTWGNSGRASSVNECRIPVSLEQGVSILTP